MTVLDNMFFVEKTEDLEQVRRYTLRNDWENPVYAAHFPGSSVTPGVCMLALVSELAGRRTGRRLSVREIVNVKFLNVLNPSCGNRLCAEIDCVRKEDGTVPVKALLSCQQTTIARFSIVFEDEKQS